MRETSGYNKEEKEKTEELGRENKGLIIRYGFPDEEGDWDFKLSTVGFKVTDSKGERWGDYLVVETKNLLEVPQVILDRAYSLKDELKKDKG